MAEAHRRRVGGSHARARSIAGLIALIGPGCGHRDDGSAGEKPAAAAAATSADATATTPPSVIDASPSAASIRGSAVATPIGIAVAPAASEDAAVPAHPIAAPRAPDRLFHGRPLEGPFDGPDGYCEQLVERGEALQDLSTDACEHGKRRDLAGAGTPFTAVVELRTWRVADDDPMRHLALRVGDAWWVLADVGHAGNHQDWHIRGTSAVGRRLRLDYRLSDGKWDHRDEEGLVVCAVGRSGTPSCVPPMATVASTTVHHGDKEDGTDTTRHAHVCTAELDGDTLVVAAGGPPPLAEADEVVAPEPDACARLPTFGRHALQFP